MDGAYLDLGGRLGPGAPQPRYVQGRAAGATDGAGQTFISALQQGSIQGGMTTDPTVAQIVDK
ncbi:hypothetical protein, partial [Streptomyces lydicus]|uniref:hypothetical protein n=1 Tax=Streptomyces lydicus TaxID=47763 RepID=UPI00332DFE30